VIIVELRQSRIFLIKILRNIFLAAAADALVLGKSDGKIIVQ
jgi:hypothetical protein